MDWLTESLRGSSHSGQYHGKHRDERIWDEAHNSVDELTDIEREEIDCAIALSLSEKDHKRKKVIDDEPESEEDEHLMKSLFEEDEHLMKAISEEDEHLMKALFEEDEHLPKDRSEEDEHLAKAQLEEDEQLAKALQEKEDEHLMKALFEEDEHLMKAISEEDEHLMKALFEEGEHLPKDRFEEDEHLAKAQLEEDEQLAKALQENDEPESEEDEHLMNALFEDDEHLMKSLSEEDEHLMKALFEEDEHLPKDRSEEDEHLAKVQLEEDEQLAKALQESMSVESPPRYDNGNISGPFSFFFPDENRICAGCNTEIGHERYLSFMGGVWHPQCFRCRACKLPITDYEFSVSGNRPYHKSCFKEQHPPRCDVCTNFIPSNSAGLIVYREHPFWPQKYCPSHERDGTPRCCSCERMEPRDTKYLLLDDGRKLCLECLDSSIMDTHECQPLYLEIQDFYEGLYMKVEQQIPMLLVERQALNEAMEGEKNGHHHLPETRGLCLSEEQTVTTILRRPVIGAGYRIINMITEPYRLTRRCEVTAILVLYGLPRLLTGSILAHEMMHAWLRLKGYSNLSPEVEEGICQVLAHMWLEAEISVPAASDVASSSSSSSPSTSSSRSSKKGKRSDFEKKLGEFFRHQIESDTSSAYGDGFRIGNQAVVKYGLKKTLDHIRMTGSFP